MTVVEGMLNDIPGATDMALEAFDSLDDAAEAYAYLAGFMVVILADRCHISTRDAIALVRTRLGQA
jgi:hypothetical protein